MERTKVTITLANIRTSKSTYYLLYDKSHSKTHHTTILPFSILLQILASQAKKQEKQEVLVKKQEKIGIGSENRKKQEKIGTGYPVFVLVYSSYHLNLQIVLNKKNACQMFLPPKVSEAKMSNPNIPSIISAT